MEPRRTAANPPARSLIIPSTCPDRTLTDIHRIVDTFNRQVAVPRYARLVPFDEIADPKNDFNLNLPRYIDSSEPEDIQDIDSHLRGGIPERDLDAFAADWQILPAIRAILFKSAGRRGYAQLKVPIAEVKAKILGHPEFALFQNKVMTLFKKWRKAIAPLLTGFHQGDQPKALIETVSETLLKTFHAAPLLDAYDIYQHLMDYWTETMQDDAYLIAADGWVARTTRILETDKKGKQKDKGWTCDLIPKPLIVARYFAKEQAALDVKHAELEATTASLAELEEEHGGEEGYFGSLDKIAKVEVNARLKEINGNKEDKDEAAVLKRWLDLSESEAALKREIRDQDAALDKLAHDKYPMLTVSEIKTLVVDDKWMTHLSAAVRRELDRASQILTSRIRELAERYATPLPQLDREVATLASRVAEHLKKMGASWK